jgi:hypothetical protein
MNRFPPGPRRLLVATAAALSMTALPSSAEVTKGDCIDANARAQDLRRDGRFALARDQLRLCADSTCPSLVRNDCVKRLDALDGVQPTIVFDATDTTGADVFDVRVSVDGQLLASSLEGTPLRVDPGVHVFKLETDGAPPVMKKILVREGEAERHERVVLGAATPRGGVQADSPAASSEMGRQQIVGLSLGGAGIAGLGLGAAFGLLASSAWSSAKAACGGNPGACTNVASGSAYHSTTETDGAISTGAFVVGGLLLVGGGVLFLTGGRQEHERAPSALVVPTFGPGQVGVGVNGAF